MNALEKFPELPTEPWFPQWQVEVSTHFLSNFYDSNRDIATVTSCFDWDEAQPGVDWGNISMSCYKKYRKHTITQSDVDELLLITKDTHPEYYV